MAEGIRRQTELENFLFIPETREMTWKVKEEKQGPVSHAHGGGSFMTVMPSVLEGSAYSSPKFSAGLLMRWQVQSPE